MKLWIGVVVLVVTLVGCTPAVDKVASAERSASEKLKAGALLTRFAEGITETPPRQDLMKLQEHLLDACDSGALLCHKGSEPIAKLPQPSGCVIMPRTPGTACILCIFVRVCRYGADRPHDLGWGPFGRIPSAVL
jgi:hypothetical protein